MIRIPRSQFTYRFAPDLMPAARIKPGEQVTFETYDASTGRINRVEDLTTYLAVRDPRRVNPACGPIYVEGAQPGDAVMVTIEAIRLASQGYVRATPGGTVLPDVEGPALVLVTVEPNGILQLPGGLRLPARPMVGVIGTAPAEGEVLTAHPGPQGSNLDCNLVRVGARVHLPVHVPGGLVALGDVHASMGDAEVSGTGVEINAEVTARIDLVPGAAPVRPWIEIGSLVAATGTAPTLEQAVSLATDGLVRLLTQRLPLTRTEAFMLISAYGDVHIGQACGGLDATAYACFPLGIVTDSGGA